MCTSLLQLSLFFDMLLCLTTDITKEEYIAGAFKQPHMTPSTFEAGESVMKRARAMLWRKLKEADIKMKAGAERRERERERERERLRLIFTLQFIFLELNITT